jgi:hypothetical protein
MTMNGTTQIRTWTNKRIFWSAVRVLIGGAFGVIVYFLIANKIVDQTHIGCYETEFIRSMVEASTFLPSLLVQSIMSTQSVYYQPWLYALSSIPYAILGALIVLRVKKLIVLVVGLLTLCCLGLSWLLWAFFMAAICA